MRPRARVWHGREVLLRAQPCCLDAHDVVGSEAGDGSRTARGTARGSACEGVDGSAGKRVW
eukprot:5313395-Pleurochrysis_carterae.AAC.2